MLNTIKICVNSVYIYDGKRFNLLNNCMGLYNEINDISSCSLYMLNNFIEEGRVNSIDFAIISNTYIPLVLLQKAYAMAKAGFFNKINSAKDTILTIKGSHPIKIVANMNIAHNKQYTNLFYKVLESRNKVIIYTTFFSNYQEQNEAG